MFIPPPPLHYLPHINAATSYPLSSFFTVKRGIETGDNGFFILEGRRMLALGLPYEVMTPILPGPHDLFENEIVADPEGYPIVSRKLFLLDVRLPEEEVERLYPSVWEYLQEGRERGVHMRYSCRHRSPWYAQELRPPAPFLCAYMGRSEEEETPLRFILNHSRAVVPNIYLMLYPKSALARHLGDDYPARVTLWGALNEIGVDEIARRERVYGNVGGRLEPNELGSIPADRIVDLFPDLVPDSAAQMTLFEMGEKGAGDDGEDQRDESPEDPSPSGNDEPIGNSNPTIDQRPTDDTPVNTEESETSDV